MNKNKFTVIFGNKRFSLYGLDKEKNFMQAPICECGCGEKCSILLNTNEDLFSFMFTVLMENECNHCAIFAHALGNKMYTAIKTENDSDDPVLFFGIEDTDMGFFEELDNELNLHCYGLMIETNRGEWEIIED